MVVRIVFLEKVAQIEKNGQNKIVGKTAVDLPEQGAGKKSYKNYGKNFGS